MGVTSKRQAKEGKGWEVRPFSTGIRSYGLRSRMGVTSKLQAKEGEGLQVRIASIGI